MLVLLAVHRIGRITGPPALSDSPVTLVRLAARASSCGRTLTGTGFAYAPDHVMASAHSVAGATGPIIVRTADGRDRRSSVVHFDPDRDVAVVRVPALPSGRLAFKGLAGGATGTLARYSDDTGPVTGPAKVANTMLARGPDLFGRGSVRRRVHTITAAITAKDSDSLLLRPDGAVTAMVFAADLDDRSNSYALTATELTPAARQGLASTITVPTPRCTT
ncbi:trypsin-like peptidase domain-containing protein [Spirillospora sp. CA-253888]